MLTKTARISSSTFIAAAISVSILGHSQQPVHYNCDFGGEENGDALVRALTADKACAVAADRLSQCRWGSSADADFAPIVISKCERDFLGKLSEQGKQRYYEEMQLCAYEYARQEGTISISEAAMCQVDVAAEFSAHPQQNDRPPSRASFECTRAKSALEHAICSDIHLGHADIVLSRVYRGVLGFAKGKDRENLISSERNWLRALPSKCGLGTSTDPHLQRLCLQSAMEERFSDLDDCEDNIDDCLNILNGNSDRDFETSLAAGERASFDCEKPNTPLQLVTCADAELGQKDIDLSEIYKKTLGKIGNVRLDELQTSQREWLEFVNHSCPMGAIGGIPPLLTRACVGSAYDQRIAQLQNCAKLPEPQQIPCLNHFRLFENDNNDGK